MRKKRQLKSISLGSEPDIPDIRELTGFMKQYKGIESDLLTFQLLRSYSAQKNAKIDETGIGGTFYRPRAEKALLWDDDQGPSVNPTDFIRDYSLLTKSDTAIRSVHESPSVLTSSPSPEDEDAFAELCHGYRQLLRYLRDNQVNGHVIHLTNPSPLEIELLSSPKVLFFLHDPEPEFLVELLEHTKDLIIPAEMFPLLDDYSDRFDIRNLLICDAKDEDIENALQYFDSDHLKIAGYCQGPEEKYWKKIKDSAVSSQ